jgi:two-component system response regulator VanR
MLTRTFTARAAQVGVSVPERISAGRLTVDLEGYDALLDGERVELTALQVELLALFLAAPSRVWSREQLTWVCWREPAEGRRVDVQLSRIRAKLGIDLFRNVRDRGWALRPLFPDLATG